jgi:hypothetical protein
MIIPTSLIEIKVRNLSLKKFFSMSLANIDALGGSLSIYMSKIRQGKLFFITATRYAKFCANQ